MIQYEWDEAKRNANLQRHGLDFLDAPLVYLHPRKVELRVYRLQELRIMAFAPSVVGVLVLVYTQRGETVRCISPRQASRKEREDYERWAEDHSNDS